MVAWFAGLFYLPRLFAYHAEQPQHAAVFVVMERKLSAYIMRPAAVATWGFGLMLAATNPAIMHMGWIHAKLALVLLLTLYHASLDYLRYRLANGTCTQSGRFFRLYNEVPTVLLMAIIMLAVVKPF